MAGSVAVFNLAEDACANWFKEVAAPDAPPDLSDAVETSIMPSNSIAACAFKCKFKNSPPVS